MRRLIMLYDGRWCTNLIFWMITSVPDIFGGVALPLFVLLKYLVRIICCEQSTRFRSQ